MADLVSRNYFRLALLATLLAIAVVMLGAYTRLSDAGLGCPDWPGCYGQLTAPHTENQIVKAEKKFSGDVVETAKAWKEMIHRYFAGTLVLCIAILAVWGFIRRGKGFKEQPIVLPILLILLVLFQAVLGMWTVTWKVLPIVVTAHLLCGMTVAALLWGLALSAGRPLKLASLEYSYFRPWALIGLLIVTGQIFLGAWTSTNYASLACNTFPYCQGTLLPPMDFHHAFNLFSPIGVDYQGGTLSSIARITIQMMHRYGAFITVSYIGVLAICLMLGAKGNGLRGLGLFLLIVLLTQFSLGVANVQFLLPMAVAVAHNGVALLLLLTMVTLVYKLFTRTRGN